MNKIQLLFHRAVAVGLLLLVQFVALYILFIKFNNYFIVLNMLSSLIGVLIVLTIVSKPDNPAYKLAWIVPFVFFPLFATFFYLLFGRNSVNKDEKNKMKKMSSIMNEQLQPKKNLLIEDIKNDSLSAYAQSKYINDRAYCPPYNNTNSTYFPLGEDYFERLKAELLKAEHFIFMEYFIIEEGKMWNEILDILVEKSKNGVDVRVVYDDVGCLITLPNKYNKKLESLGIKTLVFTPIIPIMSVKFNNRDHRKITVIDGHTAFTGGINIADEYINEKEKHGHWKDTGVMLKGLGVWSFTIMFLSLWEVQTGEQIVYENYRPEKYTKDTFVSDGFVQPYSSSPLDKETVGENIYFNLINRAKKYVYITTPYLITDNEMLTALKLASKSGIDVRIITPFVPDKKYVQVTTRASYYNLLDAGVRIYEYTPGFMHAKMFLSDDIYGTVGTVNLDYRSLHLHFECGVWFYKNSCLNDISADFQNLFTTCQEIKQEQLAEQNSAFNLLEKILVLFSPMM